MVPKPPTTEIQALIERSAAARQHLGVGITHLREKLDAPARVRESILAHPGRWLAGATASGWMVSRLVFRKSKKVNHVRRSRSLPISLLRLAGNAVMPAIKIWLLAQIKSYVANRYQAPRPPHIP